MRDWLIKIRRHDHSSLQTQIRESLVAAILDGQLERDEPVPSTRRMAKVLGVSRNTVVLAYQGLLDAYGRWLLPEFSYFVLFGPMAVLLLFRVTGIFGKEH